MSEEAVKAVVQKVVTNGKHGPFAVTTSEKIDGSITFSLEPTVWQENCWPAIGEVVLLDKIRKKRAGWRAKKGRFFKPSDEQQATRKEQTMGTIGAIIEDAKPRWFPSEDDEVWQQWVDLKMRDADDLKGLLQQNVREGLKARAVFLLLAPREQYPHVYWKWNFCGWWKGDTLSELSPDLLGFISQLVGGFHELAVSDTSMAYYNNWELELLAALPADRAEAEQVFGRFSLNDPMPCPGGLGDCTRHDISGYNPFQDLLERQDVDEEWKRRADTKMQDIVRAELEGKQTPRVEWENALSCYTRIVFDLYPFKAYDRELFAEQVRFLFSLGALRVHHVLKIFCVLPGKRYKVLRRQIARHVVSKNGDAFRSDPYSNALDETGEVILAEFGFGEEEPELVQYLQGVLEARRQQRADSKQARAMHEAKQKADEQALLEQMK